VVFNAEETRALLGGDGGTGSPVGASIRGKLSALGLAGYRAVIGRNLALLADRGN